MTPQKKENLAWIYRAVIGAMMTATFSFVVKTYNDFQDEKSRNSRQDARLESVEREQVSQRVELIRQTGRIDKIYESGVHKK